MPHFPAAKLVPANALVYVHLSTDTSRPATRRAAETASRFPSYRRLRDSIVRRLSAPGCNVGATALKGAKEVALALFYVGKGTTANSLVLVDSGREHRDAQQRGCGAHPGKARCRGIIPQAEPLMAKGRHLAGKRRVRGDELCVGQHRRPRRRYRGDRQGHAGCRPGTHVDRCDRQGKVQQARPDFCRRLSARRHPSTALCVAPERRRNQLVLLSGPPG